MDYGGAQKPGAARGARAHGPRRGRRFSGVCGLAGLTMLALWGVWLFGVVGCSGPWSGYGRTGETSGSLFAKMRQSPEEISRLEQNVHYYNLMGHPEMGLKEVELAHQHNPDNLQITDFLAQSYEEIGKFEAARQLYQEALTRHGPHAVLANNLCFSYYRQGRWQEAESCFRQTLDHDPANVAARNNLGLLYCRLGRQDEAHRLWQEAEGVAAADAKMSQALAVLGMPASAAYARKSEPAPPAARVTQAPTPKTEKTNAAVSPAALPAKPVTPAQPVSPKAAARPPAPAPAPAPVAAKTPMPAAPAPVAATPRPEPQKPAVAAPKALAAAAPAPAPQAAPRPSQTAPTDAARVKAAIEVRNGSQTKNLAHDTAFLLQREGFNVARIGNQHYAATAKTTIYYRPGTERIAWQVSRAVSPQAELAPNPKLRKGMKILVLLRDDLLENPQFMARLHDAGQPAAPASQPSAATATHAAAKTEADRPAASHQEPRGESPAMAGPEQQPLAPQSKEAAAQPLTPPAPAFLTAAELMGTAIEVRNGTWTKNLARQTRSLLSQKGFTVAKIGNHVDFGATTTIIYYRPEVEKVARAVANTVFPSAALEPSLKLTKGMDIKVLLGADLLQRPLLMAHLFGGAI